MKKNSLSMPRRGWLALAGALAALLVSACAEPPKRVVVPNELPFEQAVAAATDGLAAQLGRAPFGKRQIVADPMLEADSGQQTATTVALEKSVSDRLATKYDNFEVLPFRADNLAKATYLLTGTMTRIPRDNSDPVWRINLALTDLKTGIVAAQASALSKGAGLDLTPLPYYRDSPVMVKDKVIDGYARTSATPPGQRGDTVYLERITTATAVTEATALYNAERYQDALGRYTAVQATPAGEQLRVLNGVYLSYVKLNRMAEAEQAFGKVVAMGIAYNQLGVKFLFNPGRTDFWSDPRISGIYPMWLRQIAKEATASKACMTIVGHTSRTGSEQTNEVLSVQRAQAIRQKLGAEAAPLLPRLKAEGMGFRQNIIGSGSDNAVDALDRRVEFRIVGCG